MTRTSITLTPELQDYLGRYSTPPDALLDDLARETAESFPDLTTMQIGPEQGTFMTLLTRTVAARDAVEVGTFTGYSAICIARGLLPGGKLLTCDINEEWTGVARRYWQRAGLEGVIDLELGPALDTLRARADVPSFDLAFIDADKPGYVDYWEELLPRMRSGGLLLVDNTLSHGRVVDPAEDSPAVQGIRDFNAHAHADDRVELVMLPIGDGLTVARKL
jgi:caffeoyl-CoA O-methyltransferase